MDLHRTNIAHFMTEILSMRQKSSDHIILPTFEKDSSSNLALPSKKKYYAPLRWIYVKYLDG